MKAICIDCGREFEKEEYERFCKICRNAFGKGMSTREGFRTYAKRGRDRYNERLNDGFAFFDSIEYGNEDEDED